MPITHSQVLAILAKEGFVFSRQKGSHQVYHKNKTVVVVPKHREMKKGTAASVLEQIAEGLGLDYKDILKRYKLKI